ncbi:MAG: ACT domain-containing protein, partial [Chloroflexi bacterium]|nr:ACT domain-containing protein [Chloroflexota bacterium]
ELLDKELRHLGVGLGNREEIALLFKYESVDDFHAAIGCGELSVNQIVVKMAAGEEQTKVSRAVPPTPSAPSAVKVLGTGDLLTQLGQCCKPLPGDEIIGYITRSRGVTVHRRDCPNMARVQQTERLVSVDWGRVDQLYSVVVRVDAWDRLGLLRDITTVVAAERVNIDSVSSTEHGDNSASIVLTLEVKGITQLSRLLSKIEGISGVISAVRGGSANQVQSVR